MTPLHRPVILAAADWPDMPALKEHAAGLGADVEVSGVVPSKHCRIVWVPKDLAGNVTDAVYRQYLDELRDGMLGAAAGLAALSAAFTGLSEAFAALKPASGGERGDR